MPEPSAPTDRDVSAMRPMLDRVGGRLRRLGLSLSLWDAAGALKAPPEPIGEFCRQFCAEKRCALEAMARAAQRACLADDGPVIEQAPTGCWLLGVPLRRRRRLLGAVVACFPAHQTAESEEFVRACDRAGLDSRLMATLCRHDAQYDARQAEDLHNVLTWLIEDAQAREVARGELETLSANLSNTYEELSLLYRISGEMKVNRGAPEFFARVCREMLDVVSVQASGAVLFARAHGEAAEVVLAGDSPVTEEQLSEVAERVLRPRMDPEPRPVIENAFAAAAAGAGVSADGVRTLIAVPLMSADAHKGLLIGINKIGGDEEFDTIDLKLMGSVGGQAAVFLANHHLYADLQDLLMGMLHALTASIDAKDPYTCGHSRRVALISRRLGELNGFDEERNGRLYLAGLLHDVGKIGMPESVLLKRGRLTCPEYESVKQHPQVGADILSGIRQMEDVLPAVLHHHERPDGTGYPHGLSGGDIPVEALIVGLADSFDAMTSCRTYRGSMPLEAVLAEIRRCSGTQFSARQVELLLSLDLEAFLKQLRSMSAVEAAAGSRP